MSMTWTNNQESSWSWSTDVSISNDENEPVDTTWNFYDEKK